MQLVILPILLTCLVGHIWNVSQQELLEIQSLRSQRGVILNQEITDNTVVFKLRNIGLLSYPIGSIYQSTNSTNPSNIFGGTWSQIKDRFLLACGDNYANGSVGGEASHTLTINEIPSHAHRVYVFTGNSNNSGDYTAQYIDTSNNTLITATFGAKLTHGWNSSSFKTWEQPLEMVLVTQQVILVILAVVLLIIICHLILLFIHGIAQLRKDKLNMEIIDGSCKFKIKDKRQHHCLGEIVALISTPPHL